VKSGERNTESRRIFRVEKEMREVIGAYLISGFRGDLHGFVSVPRVVVSRDLRNAKVYVSIMGTPQDQKLSMESLRENAFDLQAEVNRRLRMKYCPKLTFFLDESMEKQLRVESILRSIAEERAAQGRAEPAMSHDENHDEGDRAE
jgi:ribosome-binding factor A